MATLLFDWMDLKTGVLPELINRQDLLVIYGTNSLKNQFDTARLLTPEELSYSERLRGPGQKETWISCRAVLRLILGLYLNHNPIDIEFKKGRFGKLYVMDCDIFFNVSHSGNSFLLGFNPQGRIGVDIEKLSGKEDLPALIAYAFSEKEANYCHTDKIVERFTETWTLKEAFLKSVGVGLVDELKSISVNGTSENSILQQKLNHQSFYCPNNETGSIVYRNHPPLKFIHLI